MNIKHMTHFYLIKNEKRVVKEQGQVIINSLLIFSDVIVRIREEDKAIDEYNTTHNDEGKISGVSKIQ